MGGVKQRAVQCATSQPRPHNCFFLPEVERISRDSSRHELLGYLMIFAKPRLTSNRLVNPVRLYSFLDRAESLSP